MQIDAEEFVKQYMLAYKEGITQTDLCSRLGMEARALSARKQKYVKAGVRLPKLAIKTTAQHKPGPPSHGRGKKLDVESLNKIVSLSL